MLSGISLSRVGIILKFLNSGTWKDEELKRNNTTNVNKKQQSKKKK